jgi:hypothetical protein
MLVTIAIGSTPQKFAAGTVGGDWSMELRLSGTATVVNQYRGPQPTASFDLVEGQAYDVRASRLDGNGAIIGPVETYTFVAGSDLVSVDVADSVSASTAVAQQLRVVGGVR